MRRLRESRQFAAEDVVKRLNAQPDAPHARRVARFLDLYQQALMLHHTVRSFFRGQDEIEKLFQDERRAKFEGNWKRFYRTHYKFASPEIEAVNRKLNQVLDELHKCTARYRWPLVICHCGYAETWDEFSFRHTVFRNADPSKFTLEEWENYAIEQLSSQNGSLIRSIWRCRECSAWFFARTEHQQFCSKACRQKFAAHSETFKQKRARYMKKYRREDKDKAGQAIRQAREGLR
jgi:hypothetical protein